MRCRQFSWVRISALASANSLASKNLDIGFANIQELNTFAVP